jgi:hypothetical protein
MEKQQPKNCELTTPSGIRVLIECPQGDPTRVPPNITPSPPPCPCSVNSSKFFSCLSIAVPGGIATFCGVCLVDGPFAPACAAICVPPVIVGTVVACKYLSTECTN